LISNQPPEFFNPSVVDVFKFTVIVLPEMVMPFDPDGGGGVGAGSVSAAVGELQDENEIPNAANKATEPAVLKKSFLDTS
jgi:hypothetical protein